MTFSLSTIGKLLHQFGGLLLYWIVLLLFGVKPAIAAVLGFILIDAAWKIAHRERPSRLWLVANGAALVFGVIDLWTKTPFMIRYEGAIISLASAIAFAIGAFAAEPWSLTFAKRMKRGAAIPTDKPEVILFFRAFTLAWSAYFLIRAIVIWWLMTSYPLVQAIALRTAFSWISLGLMMLISIKGRWFFDLCQRIGWFHPDEDGT